MKKILKSLSICLGVISGTVPAVYFPVHYIEHQAAQKQVSPTPNAESCYV
jgi:hypothetical protein